MKYPLENLKRVLKEAFIKLMIHFSGSGLRSWPLTSLCWPKHRTAPGCLFIENINRLYFLKTWEELCRKCIPHLRNVDSPLSELGPWGLARRYWKENNPEWDIVAESLDGKRLLLGEVKWFVETSSLVTHVSCKA